MIASRVRPTAAQEHAVLQSVVYASLFDYPLALAELREGLIGAVGSEEDIRAWCESSPLLRAAIEEADGFYFPRGRRELLAIRERREAASRELLSTHGVALRFVSNLPFVRMVALSGSLAHLNAARGADVDLFVITAPGRVWSVMTTAIVAARVFGWRRHLCLNYIVSEHALEVGPPDLFTANQIVHLQPIAGIEVYRRFLAANAFVEERYPNFRPRSEWSLLPRGAGPAWRPMVERVLERSRLAPLIERACRAGYGWHLRRRAARWRSRDQVQMDAERLKLHTTSHRAEVLQRFEAAMATVLGHR